MVLCQVCGSLATTEREALIDSIEGAWGSEKWALIAANPVPAWMKNVYHILGHPKNAEEARRLP